MRLRLSSVSLSFFALFFLIATPVWAATITKVSGKRVLLQFEGETVAKGDTFFALNPDGKKKGIVQVLKVKGNKAVGKIVKGSAENGWKITLRKSATNKGSSSAVDEQVAQVEKAVENKSGGGPLAVGGMLGLAMDRMDAEVAVGSKVQMSGMGFSGYGLGDYKYTDLISFRGMLGYESFDVKKTAATAICDGSTDCNAQISYLGLNLYLRFVITHGMIEAWGGVGVSVLFPMSKKSSALDTASIVSTSNLVFCAGMDWNVSPTMFIPAQLDYAMYPDSDQVTANFTAFRAGVGFRF